VKSAVFDTAGLDIYFDLILSIMNILQINGRHVLIFKKLYYRIKDKKNKNEKKSIVGLNLSLIFLP